MAPPENAISKSWERKRGVVSNFSSLSHSPLNVFLFNVAVNFQFSNHDGF
ncbi:unnamed protein product [Brassica oleracea]